MSWWYYAGPDAKPNGPVSLEELQARRGTGVISPETYVIEHAGAAGVVGGWRHYREVFPDQSSLPPLPGAPPSAPPVVASPAPVLPVITAAAVSGAHPLFPSAGATPTAPPPPAYPSNIPPHAAPHGHYPSYPTNAACAWGLGLGLAGFFMSFVLGIGILLAVPSLILSVLGLVQVQHRRNQSGAGLAITGGVLALLGLIISLFWISWLIPTLERFSNQMTTQQNSE
jgi:hypothetical protein